MGIGYKIREKIEERGGQGGMGAKNMQGGRFVDEEILGRVGESQEQFFTLASSLCKDVLLARRAAAAAFQVYVKYILEHKQLKFSENLERRYLLVPIAIAYYQFVQGIGKDDNNNTGVRPECRTEIYNIFRLFYLNPLEKSSITSPDLYLQLFLFEELCDTHRYNSLFKDNLWTSIFAEYKNLIKDKSSVSVAKSSEKRSISAKKKSSSDGSHVLPERNPEVVRQLYKSMLCLDQSNTDPMERLDFYFLAGTHAIVLWLYPHIGKKILNPTKLISVSNGTQKTEIDQKLLNKLLESSSQN